MARTMLFACWNDSVVFAASVFSPRGSQRCDASVLERRDDQAGQQTALRLLIGVRTALAVRSGGIDYPVTQFNFAGPHQALLL